MGTGWRYGACNRRTFCPTGFVWIACAALICMGVPAALAGKWQKLNNCRLVTGEYFDGDSFHVQHGDKQYIFRLYFVDAPETDHELRDRIAEQAEYFGVSEIRASRLGRKAKRFVENVLKNPFTVYTQWEDAGGSSQMPRYFAVVKIGADDLAELLVENGLARIYGASTPLPDGTSIDTFFQRLRQLEARAKRRKAGAWSGKDVPEEEETAVAEAGAPPPEVRYANVPTVAFLRAEAFVNMERFEEAEEALRALLRRFPDHVQKARIEFYLALSVAMQERFAEAATRFREWLETYPHHVLATEVRYWLPIALYYGGQFAEAIPLFEQFVAQNPLSIYAPEAEYRAALCHYALENFEAAAKRLEAWHQKYPQHYFRSEAFVTLGDALAAMGELDRAKAAYLRVNKEGGPFYYMALTQAARVFKALGTPDDFREMAAAFARFIQDQPESDNIVDAAYQAGWALRQIGRIDEAQKLYWSILERYGDRPKWEGFDLLLKDLAGAYAEKPDEFAAELTRRQQRALDERRTTLAARLMWANLIMQPEDRQWAEIPRFVLRFGKERLGTETLSWVGEQYTRHGLPREGATFFRQLLALNPESRHAALAHVRLADLAVQDKEWTNAFDEAQQALGNAAEPALVMEAAFLRARALEGLQRYSEAITDYNTVLAGRSTPRPLKPQALLGIAACLEAQGRPRQAIPYYQRVYVLYGAYREAVAQAYLRSAIAFEKLNDRQAAINTYREMLSQESLADTPEAVEARRRLLQLGGSS